MLRFSYFYDILSSLVISNSIYSISITSGSIIFLECVHIRFLFLMQNTYNLLKKSLVHTERNALCVSNISCEGLLACAFVLLSTLNFEYDSCAIIGKYDAELLFYFLLQIKETDTLKSNS